MTLYKSDEILVREALLPVSDLYEIINNDNLCFDLLCEISDHTINLAEIKEYLLIELKKTNNKSIYNQVINDKPIDEKSINNFEQLSVYINKYNHLQEEIKLRVKLYEESFIENTLVNNLIITVIENKEFLHGIEVASKSMHNLITQIINKRHADQPFTNKFNVFISIMKYLTRATTKTSPFSTFCTLKIGTLSGKPILFKYNLESKKGYVLYLDVISNENNKYRINPNYWISEKEIIYITLDNFEYNQNIINNKESINKLNKDIKLTNFFKRHSLDILSKEEWKYIINKELETFDDEVIETFIKYGILNKIDYIENPKPNFYNSLNDLEQDKRGKNRIYEDVISNQPEYISSDCELETLSDIFKYIIPVFDNSYILRETFKEFINCSLLNNDPLPIQIELFDEFLKNRKDKNLSIKGVNERLASRNHILKKISQCNDDTMNLESIIKNLPNFKFDKPVSATFFFQRTNGLIILNRISSGFGRSKLKNLKISLDKYSNNLNSNIYELYGLFGFTGNLYDYNYKKSIDIEAQFNGNYNINSLNLRVINNNLICELDGKEILPIYRGQLSTENLPKTVRYLSHLFHFDAISLDLTNNMIKELDLEKVVTPIYFPEVIYKNVILSRKKWVLNLGFLSSINSNKSFYKKVVDYFIQERLPVEFFVKPLMAKNLDNFNQIYDINKPQYINLRSKYLALVLKKLIRMTNYVEIQLVTPHFSVLNNSNQHIKEYGYEVSTGAEELGKF